MPLLFALAILALSHMPSQASAASDEAKISVRVAVPLQCSARLTGDTSISVSCNAPHTLRVTRLAGSPVRLSYQGKTATLDDRDVAVFRATGPTRRERSIPIRFPEGRDGPTTLRVDVSATGSR